MIVWGRWGIVFARFISVWPTGGYDYWMTASYISEHTMWNEEIWSEGGEAAESNREDVTESGDVWKGRKPGCRKIFRPHWVFFFFFLIACTICSLSATLDVQLLLLSWVTQLQWNYAVTPYAEHAIILPKQQSDHSASLTSRLTNPWVFVVFSWILLQIGLRDWISLTFHQQS